MSLSRWTAASFYIIPHRVKLGFHFICETLPLARYRVAERTGESIRSPRAVPIPRSCNLAVNNARLNNALKALVPGSECVRRSYTRSQMRIARGIPSARVCERDASARDERARDPANSTRANYAALPTTSLFSFPPIESKVLPAAIRRYPHPFRGSERCLSRTASVARERKKEDTWRRVQCDEDNENAGGRSGISSLSRFGRSKRDPSIARVRSEREESSTGSLSTREMERHSASSLAPPKGRLFAFYVNPDAREPAEKEWNALSPEKGTPTSTRRRTSLRARDLD